MTLITISLDSLPDLWGETAEKYLVNVLSREPTRAPYDLTRELESWHTAYPNTMRPDNGMCTVQGEPPNLQFIWTATLEAIDTTNLEFNVFASITWLATKIKKKYNNKLNGKSS